MDGEGTIDVEVSSDTKHVLIDVSDTGKGVPKNKFETIFWTRLLHKRRGWAWGFRLLKG